ncbi:hypothetical protein [Nannocystis sp.]|uniref:hypothetical protein n=1 Tax=Nannocystis sp. TaxID=1962667 RepID=UPI0025FA40A2|nr:hypothetical protein [Nannocystis sp.]MBK7826371.1 hypothetical protein [Nannocystis sp.]
MALPELPLRFAVAGEDEAHHFAVTTLTDRILTEQVAWLDGNLDACRIWCETQEGRSWSVFVRARKELRQRDLRRSLPTGHFGRGDPAQPDARFARAQLHIWKDANDRGERLDVVFIARDLDHKDGRLLGLRQAIAERPWPFAVVLAWFQPEAEAWFIAGHEPRGEDQRERHAQLRSRLGFCPIEQPHRLLSTRDDSEKDAKVVWATLKADDPDARLRSMQVDLDRLRRNGAQAGVADFLDRIFQSIVPLLSGPSR